MWEVVAAAAVSQAANAVWLNEYNRATPERRVVMIRERKDNEARREKEAAAERRHREQMEALRSAVRSSQSTVHHTSIDTSNGGFTGGFLGGLIGSMFK